MTVSASGLASVAAGSVLIYAGVKGYSVPQAFQAILQGKSPTRLSQTAGINTSAVADSSSSSSSGGSSKGVVSSGSNKEILQKTAAEFGWTGDQWTCLDNVEVREAGYNAQARNPSSGAFGMAQALGHGVPGGAGADGTNEYGGYGLTVAQARLANNGDPGTQALWMCNYIRSAYGNPCNAWKHEQAFGWY